MVTHFVIIPDHKGWSASLAIFDNVLPITFVNIGKASFMQGGCFMDHLSPPYQKFVLKHLASLGIDVG